MRSSSMMSRVPQIRAILIANSRRLDELLQRNASIVLMLSAQACSTILATLGRILRTGHSAPNSESTGTSEILLFMMVIVSVLSWMYMFLSNIPEGPFGHPKVRGLLVARGVAGFFGIWGFYASLRYLALAEATLINFTAPIIAVVLLGMFPGQRYSITQLIAASVSVLGVVCVLQPWSAHAKNTPAEHAQAIGAAFVGAVGGAVSYVIMSRLEQQAHPITTVAYFSTLCTILNGGVLVLQRHSLHFPTTKVQWLLVCVLGLLGFVMHWLMAASLMWNDDSKRALTVVYVQVVFAMIADKLVWNVSPGAWKYAGGSLIVCGSLIVASTTRTDGYALVQSEMREDDEIGL